MTKRLIAAGTAILATIALAACGSPSATARLAEAAPADECSWSGSATDVINAANNAVGDIDLADPVHNAFGDTAIWGPPRMSELKFAAVPDATQPAGTASDFSSIEAIYNLPVFPDGELNPTPKDFASIHLNMSGLCTNFYDFVPAMWMETFGVSQPQLELQDALQAGLGWLKDNTTEETYNQVNIQDMLLYKRLADGFPQSYFMRGRIGTKLITLQIDMDGTVTPM